MIIVYAYLILCWCIMAPAFAIDWYLGKAEHFSFIEKIAMTVFMPATFLVTIIWFLYKKVTGQEI